MPLISQETMQELIDKAAILVEALPFMREFEGKTVVVKFGGSAMVNPRIRQTTAEDIVLLKYVGLRPVVVHGGGPEISATLQRFEIESRFHEGLRVTDDETIQVVEMVLCGRVNKDLVALLNRVGGNAVGLSGKDGNLIHAEKIQMKDGADIGHVGQIRNVHFQVLNVLCEADMIPVIAPVATDPDGGSWNVNADTAAGEIAAALQAEKLVFLTDTPGVLRDPADPESLIHEVTYREVLNLTKQGVIAGGMIPKVQACLKGLDFGVNKTHIIDGRIPHALLLEIFTERGLGTLVSH
jgi:acetylglutamate kinase